MDDTSEVTLRRFVSNVVGCVLDAPTSRSTLACGSGDGIFGEGLLLVGSSSEVADVAFSTGDRSSAGGVGKPAACTGGDGEPDAVGGGGACNSADIVGDLMLSCGGDFGWFFARFARGELPDLKS